MGNGGLFCKDFTDRAGLSGGAIFGVVSEEGVVDVTGLAGWERLNWSGAWNVYTVSGGLW